MSDLVKKLSQAEQPVEISLRPERNVKALRDCIDRGYVHVKFTGTKGGTELGVRLDKDASNLNADFDQGVGKITLVGGLTLDYVKVQCVAEIDLSSLSGKGRLIPA
jgi:hypothetical protein